MGSAFLALTNGLLAVQGQVDEGGTQVVNIRETDSRLGPLVFTLIGLGVAALVATVVFWWLTRPQRLSVAASSPVEPG